MKKSPHKLALSTLLTHYQEGGDSLHAHINPIYQTSTFSFPDVQTGADIFAAKNRGFAYTRSDNPNARQLAAKLALLEGIDLVRAQPEAPVESLVRGKIFGSGMAAISTAIMARVQAGSTILAQKILYGNAYNLLKKVVPLYGIQVVWVDGGDPAAWEAAFAAYPEADLVYLETPANPTMEIVDLQQVAQLAHSQFNRRKEDQQAWVIVDNTFATPYCQRPFNQGADIVVHSTTKYLSGHGLIIGGAVITRHPEFLDPQQERFIMASKVFGGAPSPFDAWLANIGLKTFELRMARHVENADRIARWLADQPQVARVYYPGLADFPGHEIAQRQMFNGFGGMLSFELKDGYAAAVRMLEKLELVTLAVSLGNVDSLIEHPASMTHAALSPEDRASSGVTDGLIRFSPGIESANDLIADLEQAFDQISR
jgi:methionine-gamma-lyase